jgi:hypothetical protein
MHRGHSGRKPLGKEEGGGHEKVALLNCRCKAPKRFFGKKDDMVKGGAEIRVEFFLNDPDRIIDVYVFLKNGRKEYKKRMFVIASVTLR